MARTIDLGTVSSRGQIAIPSKIRAHLELNEGEKVLFILDGDTLLVRKVLSLDNKAWEGLTRVARKNVKKSDLKESDVVDLVHRARKTNN